MDNQLTLQAGWRLAECPFCRGSFSNPYIRPSVRDRHHPPLVLPREISPDPLQMSGHVFPAPRYEDYPSCPHCRSPLNITVTVDQAKEKPMNLDNVIPLTDEKIVRMLGEIQRTTVSPDGADFNNITIAGLLKRFQETDTELQKWRSGGVTEELLRKGDGYIKVGNGVELALAGTTTALESHKDALRRVRELVGANDAESVLSVIATLKADASNVRKTADADKGWHGVVLECERILACPDTATSPLI